MNKNISIFACLLALMTISNTAFANTVSGDQEKGKVLSETCLGCHGTPGLRNASPVYRVPMIGGQNAEYIINALKAYKAKTRSHTTMQAQAANLSEQNMKDIAAYFESLTNKEKPFTKIGANAGKEKAAVCAGCHGADGVTTDAGKKAGYPTLAGQYDDYIERALHDYKSEARKGSIMTFYTKDLSNKDIKDLARWFRSQAGNLNNAKIDIIK